MKNNKNSNNNIYSNDKKKSKSNKGLIGLIVVAVAMAAIGVFLVTFFLKDNGIVKDDTKKITEEISEPIEQEKVTTPISENLAIDDFMRKYDVPKLVKTVGELANDANADIYAVVSIPGCGIEEPVCQRSDDELYYCFHNEKGEEDENGCIYSQVFNSKDFSDNLTVIYGRNTGDGKRFSNLHYFEDPEFLAANPYIYVYTASELLVYKIFGAYKYSDIHLIVGYDTNSEEGYNNYLVSISEIEPGFNDNFVEDTVLDPEDKMLTLSTGNKDDYEHRYLVQGILADRTYLK